MATHAADRLAEVTGLCRQAAEKCLRQYSNDYRTALASVVQSLATLPADVFDYKGKLEQQAKTINNELRETYAMVREVMQTTDNDESGSWRVLRESSWDVKKAIDTYKANAAPANKVALSFPNAAANIAATAALLNPAAAPIAAAAVPSNSTATPPPTFPFASAFASPAKTAAAPGVAAPLLANPSTSTLPPAPAAFSFGFGQAPVVSGTAVAPQGFGSAPAPGAPTTGPTSTAPIAAKSQTSDIPLKKLVEPKHFTGSYLEMPHFWREEVEARCTLLNMDRGFLFKNKDVLRERLLKWVDVAGSFHRDVPLQYYEIVDEDEETTRVIIKDVVRTFFYEEHRSKLTTFLFSAFQELKHYGQPMSFLAAICLLALNEQETMAVLRKVAKEYIPGHWAPEAVGFATSAWLVERIMRGRFPDVASHFDSLNFWPDTYMQKILSGLTVHVLPFDLMFGFLDSFMQEGFLFLIKFELAIIQHFKSELLAIKEAKQMNELYEIMRLDVKSVDPSEARKILQVAQKMDSRAEDLQNLDMFRMKVYDEKVLPRLQRAPKEEAFEPCGICDVARPQHWCDSCGLAICDHCHTGRKGTHSADHEVEKY